MKIAFINISAEPGRDGVGDYVRGFAAELHGLSHTACVVALNDRFVEVAVEEDQLAGAERIPTLRLPANREWGERVALARSFLDAFRPDWVSLQFVCYGFQRKGFVHGLGRRMEPLLKGRRLHLMFHEIWIGEQVGAAWKERVIGAMQRLFIRRLIRKLQPQAMHTSNAPYQAVLARYGIDAELLPLFGAIPVCERPDFRWIEERLRDSVGGDFVRERFWLFGMFGGLTSNWPPEPLFSRILNAAGRAGKRIMVLSIGRIGGGESLWERMSRDYSERIGFLRLGEQPSERVSEFLSYLDYGIAASPWLIIGKSSTVASMLEHGLPMIVNRDDAHFRVNCEQPHDPLLMKCEECLEARLLAGVSKGPHRSRREQIVRDFLASLEGAGGTISESRTKNGS